MIKEFQIENYQYDLVALLAYSFLPGFSKIMDQQFIMLFAFPIILYIIVRHRSHIKFYKTDYLYIFFLGYCIILTSLYLIFPYANKLGVSMAVFLDIIPMLGYVYSREINFKILSKFLVIVISAHCIVAIILYPPFQIVPKDSPVVKALTEGVAIGRMSSVSGSLGFGNLILTGVILSIFIYRKFLPLILFCWLFSGQRSAWVGGVLGILVVLFLNAKSGDLKKSLKIFILMILGMLMLFIFLNNILNIDLSFIIYRLSELGNASGERSEQWVNGLMNFKDIPIGAGPGQAGQVAARYEQNLMGIRGVPDGDYFRVMSEFGIGGLLFYFSLIIIFIILIIVGKLDYHGRIVTGIMAGNLFQMIGSNISEFFYTNFVFWIIIGYFFYYFAMAKIINRKRINYIR